MKYFSKDVDRMDRLYEGECDVKLLSPSTLAFIGDCVFEIFARDKVICDANYAKADLHAMSSRIVCCVSQAKAFKKISSRLTQEEYVVFKRGRNAHVNNTPKNATAAEYHIASGVEALFGYLYLLGRVERLREIFNAMLKEDDEIDVGQ